VYPHLDATELAALTSFADLRSFKDGHTVFHAGQCDLDLVIVNSGGIDLLTGRLRYFM
jgi:hypothetical protein